MIRRSLGRLGLAAGAALWGLTGCGDTGGETGAGSITFTASGEVLALGGYAFPAPSGFPVEFVDGWAVTFSEVLVTVDKITVSEGPDQNPGDQSKTGALVAQLDGPWAVDLHKGGPLAGKGGTDEQAVEIARLDNQNKNGGAPFESDARYAFGFDVVAATAAAQLVNLDEQGKADYALMQQNGYTVLYVGEATWKGTSCTPADPVFDALPKVVKFKLGFKSPTTYVNCQNPDLDPATPIEGEEHQRGLSVKVNQTAVAQLTLHTDHPFWDSSVHDSPPHFDPIAARFAGFTGTPEATLEDLKGVDPTALTDKQNSPLPWRTCTSSYTPPSGQMSFDPGGLPINPSGDPATSIRDLYDFMTYNQSTQGHLNADGLCSVKRNYPSPP